MMRAASSGTCANPTSERRMHVPIRQQGFANHRIALQFGDYLHASPTQRARYETLKRRLALHFPTNIDDCMSLEDAPIRMVIEPGAAWAPATGWMA
jgi:GrpB-like predicted nucleotidyltransferase (UPF0157 family)